MIEPVNEMLTYLSRKVFYKWVFNCSPYTTFGLYLVYSASDRDEKGFREIHSTCGGGGELWLQRLLLLHGQHHRLTSET